MICFRGCLCQWCVLAREKHGDQWPPGGVIRWSTSIATDVLGPSDKLLGQVPLSQKPTPEPRKPLPFPERAFANSNAGRAPILPHDIEK